MPYIDENDAFDTLFTVFPKDLANIPTGNSTYGLFEYIIYLDDLFFNAWMTMADINGMGLCYGLMATTFFTRLFFTPLNIYTQMVGHKMKLL